jgi:hypothetical protein
VFARVTTGSQGQPAAPVGASIAVSVTELPAEGCTLASAGVPGSCSPKPGGITTALLLNPPGALAGGVLAQPDGSNFPIAESEVYTPFISSASVTSPNLASVTSASVTSASVTSASVTSASVTSTHIAVPQLASVTSASVTSASVTSSNIASASVTSKPLASVTSASVTSASVTSAPLSDANYTLKNDGNTTHSYHVKLVGNAPSCGTTSCPIQLILSKPYGSPAAVNCELVQNYAPVIVANVDDVSSAIVSSGAEVANPAIPDPRTTNATITLAPGESGVITIRGPLSLAAMQSAVATLTPVVVPHAGGSYAAALAIIADPLSGSQLAVGVPFTAQLQAVGGTGSFTWSVVAGSLPQGLSLAPNGAVTGTPQAAGTSTATLQLTDGVTTVAKEVTLVVAAGTVTTTLAVSGSTVYGSPVVLTATVASAQPGVCVPAPSGTVTFRNGTIVLGTATLAGSNGQSSAVLQLATLPATVYSLVAEYSGDANFAGSPSAPVLYSVARAVPLVAVTGGTFTYDGLPHPAVATVSGVGGASVEGVLSLTYVPGGTLAPAGVGSYAANASFVSADLNYTDASATATVVITPAATTITVTASSTSAWTGTSVTFTATVRPAAPLAAGALAPSGLVTFSSGATSLGTAPLAAGGVATLTPSALAAGAQTVTAAYPGDATFAGSTSAALSITVKAPYTFVGFDSPLAPAGTMASPTYSGTWGISRVLPVKWKLSLAGTPVTAVSAVKLLTASYVNGSVGATSCPLVLAPTTPTTTVVLYNPTSGAAGGSTFRSGSTGYIFNWDATKAPTGRGCYWIRLLLEDGSPEKVTVVLLN